MIGSRQQGVALITAILMVTLATIAAVAMATRQQLDIRRTANLLHGIQALSYTEAAESWAQAVLARDAKDSSVDTLEEDWATKPPASIVEGGTIEGRLIDLQSRFNLNSLVDAKGKEVPSAADQFKRLLIVLKLDEMLADTLLDWIDEDQNAHRDGAEDQEYLLTQPSYRTANRPIANMTELRLIKGFDQEVLDTLLPFVCALPEATPINVNTASAEVLRSLDSNITGSEADQLVADREGEGYQDIKEFQDKLKTGISIDPSAISVTSDWFRLLAVANIGQARAVLTSQMQRGKGKLSVISRERVLREPLRK